MILSKNIKLSLALTAFLFCCGGTAFAGSAVGVFGLYYTGVDDAGALLGGGTRDSHWSVSYAHVNNTNYTGDSTYSGNGYVLDAAYIGSAYAPNSGTSKWITAPGASTLASGGTLNIGGAYLPGNGTSGANDAQYLYRLAFTITGTGSGTVTNNVSISLSLAADDQYSVYINPTLRANGSVNAGSSTLGGSRTSAWGTTSALYLQNFTDSNGSANANFVIGTNYLYVVVDNTNSKTGNQTGSGSSDLNLSGLLVYQVGSTAVIDGVPVPEVGTWLPVVVALGLFGWSRVRRRTDS